MDSLKACCPSCGKLTTVSLGTYRAGTRLGRTISVFDETNQDPDIADRLVPEEHRNSNGFLPGHTDGTYLTMQRPKCCMDPRTLLFVVKDEKFRGFAFE